jgi:hypothetical protein
VYVRDGQVVVGLAGSNSIAASGTKLFFEDEMISGCRS